MNRAEKLFMKAKSNRKSFKQGDIVKCDGEYQGYPKGIYYIRCEGVIPNTWCLTSIDGIKEYSQSNGVPEKHLTKYSYDEQKQAFLEEVYNLSKSYVESVIIRCEELANLGYGSVEIKIDCTTDLFDVIELNGTGYSHNKVVSLLQEEGFNLEFIEDYYDAKSYILSWQVKPDFSKVMIYDSFDDEALLRAEQEWEKTKLPQAPHSKRIGMAL